MKYYLAGLLVIVVLPALLVLLYERLAGGILNGTAGSWREAAIDSDILLVVVNPLLLLMGYATLIYFFRKYIREKKSVPSRIAAYSVFLVATTVVVIGTFWKALTT